MKARIEVKYEERVVEPEKIKKGWLGSKTVIPAVTHGAHCVYLYLEASEEEKAIIKANELEEAVVEEIPVPNALADHQRELAEAKNDLHRKIIQDVWDEHPEHRVRKRTLAEFMDSPWWQGFSTKMEANEYANKLKTKILPHIKQLLDAAKAGPISDSFDL